MMNVQKSRFGGLFPWERDFTRQILALAVPVVVQSLMTACLHIVDNLMIGSLGETELAAVTQANRVTFLFNLLVFGLCGGLGTLAAQYWGRRDLFGIRQVFGVGLALSLGAALLFAVPSVAAPAFIMRLLLKEEEAVACAATYLPIVAVGYVFSALTQCYSVIQRSTERARLPMTAGIVSIITNTILNYLLIFGKLGFPRLGVEGGALATTIATAAGFAVVALGGRRAGLATTAKWSDLIPRSRGFVHRTLRVVVPVMANEGLWSLGVTMYSVVYGRLGTGVVAAISIVGTVEQLAFTCLRGATQSCAVVVGSRIGAGDRDGAQLAARRMTAASGVLGLASGLALCAVSGLAASLFNVSEAVRAQARVLILINGLTMPLGSMASCLIVGVLRAGGDVNYSAVVDAGLTWGVGATTVAFTALVLGLPLPLVYLLSYSEHVVKLFFCLSRLRSRKWIHDLTRAAN